MSNIFILWTMRPRIRSLQGQYPYSYLVVTNKFLLKFFATPARPVGLRLAHVRKNLAPPDLFCRVRAPGFEPGTYRVSVDCSSHLSYARIILLLLHKQLKKITTQAHSNQIKLAGKLIKSQIPYQNFTFLTRKKDPPQQSDKS